MISKEQVMLPGVEEGQIFGALGCKFFVINRPVNLTQDTKTIKVDVAIWLKWLPPVTLGLENPFDRFIILSSEESSIRHLAHDFQRNQRVLNFHPVLRLGFAGE